MTSKELYREWLNSPYFDEETKAELRAIEGDEKEIEERFYRDLEFGTAGLRGIIGAGTNRMNFYTVRKATQGLANYILKAGTEKMGVAIAYDSRHFSPEFAREASLCLNANGIKTYVFDALRPTPELSFAVRYHKCTAGINITASHNPAKYNGYKVYWADGAQITPPHDKGIMDCVRAVTDFSMVKTMTFEDAVKQGLYIPIGEETDRAYLDELKKLISNPEAIKSAGGDLQIVYTPLHGTGNVPVRRLLKEIGFENVHVVKEQELPDGAFPTVSYPNPETKEAFELGLKLAKEVNADIILATDPDADRLGVYVKDGQTGEYHVLNGNMSGAIICQYLMSQKKEIPADGYIVRSVVSTNLMDAIAKAYNVELKEVLTGFKHIGAEILKSEENGKGTYLFGMEESYGCLPGTYARDKDAVAATMILCEAAAYYKEKGLTLWNLMCEMNEKYGYYIDEVTSVTMEGKEGLEKIASIMENLRSNPPEEFGGFKVLSLRDYQTGIIKDKVTGEERGTGLPKSNVLYYDLENDAWMCVRPSGTEPKIKFYFGVVGKDENQGNFYKEKVQNSTQKLLSELG